MKYVTVEIEATGKICVATFSEDLIHSFIAKGMVQSSRGNVKIRSAGFCYVEGRQIILSDRKSDSLKGLGPADDDIRHLTHHLLG